MIADVIDALDRRYRLLERQLSNGERERGQVLPEIAAFVEFLHREPRLDALMEDLLEGARAEWSSFRSDDRLLVGELNALRGRLAREYPAIDDSQKARPGPDQHDPGYQWSLAYFDEVVGREDLGVRVSVKPDDKDPKSRASVLVGIIRGKVEKLGSEGTLDGATQAQFWHFEQRSTHLDRRWTVHSRVAATFSALRLELAAAYLNPPADPIDEGSTQFERLVRAVNDMSHPYGALRSHTFGEQVDRPGSTSYHEERERKMVRVLHGEASRVYEELRARLGTTRSLRGLFGRFRRRAQLYDADELRIVAEQGENALTERLARFLFDAGLNPLTRPLVGRLEPDLVDTSGPWSLYVEAKKYDTSSARGYLRQGIEQVCDTLSNLQGHPRAIREVFYVVFRLGGPRYELPEEVRRDGVVIHPILIDIAPNQERGSRRKTRTIRIPVEEWMPADDS